MDDFTKKLLKEKPSHDAHLLQLKNEIANTVYQLNPLEIMLYAMRYMRMICIMRNRPDEILEEQYNESETLTELEENNALLIPEYLQSLLISLPESNITTSVSAPDTEKRLETIISKCEELIEVCSFHKMLEFAEAYPEQSDNDNEIAIRDFQMESYMYEGLRGKRYQLLEEKYLNSLLSDQDLLIQEVYGIGAQSVVKGVIALRDSLCLGWSKTIKQLNELMDDTDKVDWNDPLAVKEVYCTKGGSSIINKLFGTSLFDVAKNTNWPQKLIDDLSRPALSEKDSLDSAYNINPLGILPIRNHPFISIDGKSYCFCYANLVTLLQKSIHLLFANFFAYV